MNVQKITAFKSEDGAIWEKEAYAINNNIDDAIRANLNCDSDSMSTSLIQSILAWFKNHPKDIKYIQAHVKKLDPEHFGEEAE